MTHARVSKLSLRIIGVGARLMVQGVDAEWGWTMVITGVGGQGWSAVHLGIDADLVG